MEAVNRPVAKPVRLGPGHCCACAGTGNHIGPIQLCAMHERPSGRPVDRGCIIVTREHLDELLDVPRSAP